MTDVPATLPAVGWYADPVDAALVRWWSGIAWTEHTMAAPIVVPEPIATPATTPITAQETTTTGLTPSSATSWIMDPVAPRVEQFSPMARAQSRTMYIPGRWNTAGAWGIAFLPWISVATGIAVALLDTVGIRSWVWWTAPFLPLLCLIAFAVRDRARLDQYGYKRAASLAWILLGPLAYMIARTVRVRQQSGKGSAPLWIFVLNSVLVAAVGFGVGFWLYSQEAQQQVTAIEQSIQIDLRDHGQNFVIHCPTDAFALNRGSVLSCTATDAQGSDGSVEVTVGSAGRFSYVLYPPQSGPVARGS